MAKLIAITGKALSGEWGTEAEPGRGIPVLRTTNFTNDGTVNLNDVVTRAIYKKNIDEKYLRKGDIIIEKSGGSDSQPVGRVIYFDGPDNTYLFNNFTGLLRVKDQAAWLPRYVFYALFANYRRGGTRQFENKTTGLHNLKIDGYLADFDVPECDLTTQERICCILDSIRDTIFKRNQQLAKLDDLAKARFSEVFVTRYPTAVLGDVIKTTSGGTPSSKIKEYYEDGTIPWLTSGEINQGQIYHTANYITEEGFNNSSAKWVPENSVVIAMYGATAGKTSILRIPATTNQAVCTLIPNGKFDVYYLYYAVKLCERWMIENRSGAAQPNISQAIIKKMKLTYAPIGEQKKFAQFACQVDKSKAVVQSALDKAQLLFDSLMQKYFG